ncbi:uncharacterized protein LOC128868422 [Anastrepha ludens]|uniref:uncharacterized protein LOC128868422 n=1 Tax=Anastrepha ludens TaxID=28586 RepID=UPI0023AFD0A3|nr:uncharacterized protein LOC128868422 [Anastrepha ludens]
MPSIAHPRFIFYLLCAASLLAVVRSDPNSTRKPRRYEDSNEDIAYEAAKQLGQLNYRLNQLAFEEQSRQISLPNVTINNLVSRIPCTCDKGICKCCAGFLSVIGLNSCTEVVYRPEEFSFELRMRVNNNVWFKRKVSGQNPPPFCFRPPRFNFARACIQFHDIWFVGRNMHVCMYLSGSFQGYELFERNFDCLLFGDKGVKIVKPEQGYPVRPTDVDIDDGDDEIEEYDENVVRRKRHRRLSKVMRSKSEA